MQVVEHIQVLYEDGEGVCGIPGRDELHRPRLLVAVAHGLTVVLRDDGEDAVEADVGKTLGRRGPLPSSPKGEGIGSYF